MFSSIKILIILCLLPLLSFSQSQEGFVSYEANSPKPVLLTGAFKPVITLGDEVTITLSGTVNLRPYEVEKKKGGIFGIGSKRYKERHNNELAAENINTEIRVDGTNYVSNNGIIRQFTIDESQLKSGSEILSEVKKEYVLTAFINEAGKNPHLGWSKLKLTVDIETRGRILYIIRLLEKETPKSFEALEPLIELGNVMRQHPDELAKEIIKFYKTKPEILTRIKQDLYEYLLIKSPSNQSIRSELALTYVQSLQFRKALSDAKVVIEKLGEKSDENLSNEEKVALATSYFVLGEVTVNERMGTQTDAYLIGAKYYNISAGYFRKIGYKDDYIKAILKQVKCLQSVSTVEALLEAAEALEEYFKI
jgi:hypothetical protein